MRLRALALTIVLVTATLLRAQNPVIIDTDIGDDIDDVFALSLALSSPDLQILGVTSAWGDTALRARMIDRLLCETGRTAIPVHAGVPTRTDTVFTQKTWALAGIEHPHTDGVAFLLEQIKAHPHQITLIALGPLTNIGAAIDRDPATFRQLKRVVLMGGSIYRGYGPTTNTKPEPEYNIARDPKSAQKLFTSGVPLYVLPLDSTQLPFDADRMAAFTTISTPLTDALQLLAAEWKYNSRQPAPTLYDAVATAYAIDPATCPMTPLHLEVDDKGMTLPTEGKPNAQACLTPHPEAFFNLFTPR
ncbi:MAG: nucleoside hydrolase, partial [Edaphobacter sp.]|uniref:nucleoside hydrolase n=1 Tax=Edaphobacter sp. TaxID=1934404 RepID=UPI00238D1B96